MATHLLPPQHPHQPPLMVRARSAAAVARNALRRRNVVQPELTPPRVYLSTSQGSPARSQQGSPCPQRVVVARTTGHANKLRKRHQQVEAAAALSPQRAEEPAPTPNSSSAPTQAPPPQSPQPAPASATPVTETEGADEEEIELSGWQQEWLRNIPADIEWDNLITKLDLLTKSLQPSDEESNSPPQSRGWGGHRGRAGGRGHGRSNQPSGPSFNRPRDAVRKATAIRRKQCGRCTIPKETIKGHFEDSYRTREGWLLYPKSTSVTASIRTDRLVQELSEQETAICKHW